MENCYSFEITSRIVSQGEIQRFDFEYVAKIFHKDFKLLHQHKDLDLLASCSYGAPD